MTTDTCSVSSEGERMDQKPESGMACSVRKLRIQIEGLDQRIERLWTLGGGHRVACREPLKEDEDRRDVSFHSL